MASSIKWLRAICSGRSAIPCAGSKSLKMWSIILWEVFLLSLVIIRKFPLERRPQEQARSRLRFVIIYHSHRICTRAPVRLGTVRAGFGITRTGVCLGSLLISTPGRALRPGSQAGLRRLIVNPDRVSAAVSSPWAPYHSLPARGRKLVHFATSHLPTKPENRLCGGPI